MFELKKKRYEQWKVKTVKIQLFLGFALVHINMYHNQRPVDLA